MSKLIKKTHSWSISKIISWLTILVMTPVVILLTVNSIFSYRNALDYSLSTRRSVLDTLTSHVSNELNLVSNYIATDVLSSADYQIIASTRENGNTTTYNSSVYQLNRHTAGFLTPYVTVLYTYNPNRNDLITYNFGNVDTSTLYTLKEKLNDQASTSQIPACQLIRAKETSYFVNSFYSYGGYAGVWYDLSSLFAEFKNQDFFSDYLILFEGTPVIGHGGEADRILSSDDPVLSLTRFEKSGSHMVLRSACSDSLDVIVLIEASDLASPGRVIFQIAALLILITVLLILAQNRLLNRTVTTPLRDYISATEETVKSEMNIRLPEEGPNAEMTRLYKSFNNMLDEIKALEINVREEQEERFSAEYNYLRSQINPHFFMNLLNTIYSMILAEHTDEALSTIEFMADYYRYVLRRQDSLVLLSEEFQHIESYLEILKKRYGGNLFWKIDLPPETLDHHIPILSLQTLVENSINHALTDDHPLHLEITGSTKDGILHLSVADDGAGFPDEILQNYKNLSREDIALSSHIGIKNILRRFFLLYGDDASMELSNDGIGEYHTGARVTLTIPEKG